jgi:hypothetical protein
MQCREGVETRNVPEQVARVLEVLLQLSFAAPEPKSEARVYRLELLAAAAKINCVGNLSKVLDAGEKAKIFRRREERVQRRSGRVVATCIETIFEIKPAWQNWQLPDRYTHEVLARAERALALLRDGRDPEQGVLFERERDLEDGFVAASRDLDSSAGVGALVPGTTGGIRCGDSDVVQPLVPGTSGTSMCEVTEETEAVVPGTTGPPLKLKVPTMEPLKALKGESAAGQRLESAASPMALIAGFVPDIALVERMEAALGPEQLAKYGKLWHKRLEVLTRPMRVTVDAYHDRGRALPPIAVPWSWILDGYVSRAVEMGLSDRLLPCDQEYMRKKLNGTQPRWRALAALLRKATALFA